MNSLRTLRLGIGLGLLLLCISIPFEFSLLPSVGIWLRPFFDSISSWIGQGLFPDCERCIWEIISDSHGLYLLIILSIIIGCVIAIIIEFRWRRRASKIHAYVRAALICYLSLQVASYGVQKLLMQQFFAPEANTLFTPIGQMEKDILFWSTMGVSRSYNFFLGILEIIPALMILHYRTRTIGLAILSMVLLHVLVIDISYDIDVKVYAGFLLLITSYLIAPSLKEIWKQSQPGTMIISSKPLLPKKSWHRILRPFLLTLLIVEMVFPIIDEFTEQRHAMIPTNLIGAYQVQNADDEIQKVFLHSKGYLITMDWKGQFRDHRIMMDQAGGRIIFLDGSSTLSLWKDPDQIAINIRGELAFRPVDWRLLPIDLNELPLLKDQTEYFVRVPESSPS